MLLTPVSHRLRTQSRLQNEEEPSSQDASFQERRREQSKPAEEADFFLYVETPSPALQRRAVLNQALNQLEATQVAKQYSSPDMFLSEQVGNPQKAKELVEKQSFVFAFIDGMLLAGVFALGDNAYQRFTNRYDYQRLSAEAHSHAALAPLANVSEKNELWGEITTALKDKSLSNEAKAILTRIRANANASVADLHHALAGFKHLQAREVLEGERPLFSKWFPLLMGLGSAAGIVYSAYRHSPEAEKRQVETNRRNRAILNQAGRDITVLQAKENFPEYYSALACSQSRQT
ncbi:MAG: hypothetical protein ACK551_07130 [Vampirovibrionales bacterium]